MKKRTWSLFLVLSFLSLQCGKDEQPEKPPPAAKIDVSRYTIADPAGIILAEDNTDWTLDNNWTAEEKALFEAPSPAQLEQTETANITIRPAFPNPMANDFILRLNTSKAVFMQWVTVDTLLQVKERNYLTTNGDSNIRFSLDASKYATNTTYRFYYTFYSKQDGAFARGHGDIRVVK